MKIDRRDFLSLGIGAAAGIGAGTALSSEPHTMVFDYSDFGQVCLYTPCSIKT